MTRRPLVLSAILLWLVVMAAVSEPMWLATAYRKGDIKDPGGIGAGMFYLEKRFHWLPGRTHIVPPQPCGNCRRNDHASCYHGLNEHAREMFGGIVVVEGRMKFKHSGGAHHPGDLVMEVGWACTCRDTLHARR